MSVYADKIKTLNDAIEKIKADYKFNTDLIERKERENLDYLHQIELGERKDVAKTTTKLRRALKERRKAKDYVRQMKPIIEFLNSHPQFIPTLKQFLGLMRKREKPVADRRYYPREIKDLPISKEA